MGLEEVVRRANAAQRSYGTYVWIMGSKIDRSSKEYKLEGNEIRCKACETAFTPKGKQQIYCSERCRRSKRNEKDRLRRLRRQL
jgi:hypothetical protein